MTDVENLIQSSRRRPPTCVGKIRRSRRGVSRVKPRNRGLSEAREETLNDYHWFLAKVPSGKEFVAERILDDAGLLVFVPIEERYRKANRTVREKKTIRVALIPGYVLVAMPPVALSQMPWMRLFRFRLVAGVVGRDGLPSRVPAREAREMIRRHCAGEFMPPSFYKHMRSYREFQVGDTVEVLEGPFEGNVFEVTAIKGQNAQMVVDIFGGQREVTVPLEKLAKAG